MSTTTESSKVSIAENKAIDFDENTFTFVFAELPGSFRLNGTWSYTKLKIQWSSVTNKAYKVNKLNYIIHFMLDLCFYWWGRGICSFFS